ncbi:hypothetical protein HDU77_003134 [Chytriomyces hyalinus]|nr:hypothetical protein HDU77_003134 [Chytriomyces hyalinus]
MNRTPQSQLTHELRERVLASGARTSEQVAAMTRSDLIAYISASEKLPNESKDANGRTEVPVPAGSTGPGAFMDSPLLPPSRFPYPRFATVTLAVNPPPTSVTASPRLSLATPTGSNSALGASAQPNPLLSAVTPIPPPSDVSGDTQSISQAQFPARSSSTNPVSESLANMEPVFVSVAVAPSPPTVDQFLRAKNATANHAADLPHSPKIPNANAGSGDKLPHELLLESEKGKNAIPYNPWSNSLKKTPLANRISQRNQSTRTPAFAAQIDEMPQVLQDNIEAAEIGDSDSMYTIGKAYLEGSGGLDRDVGWAMTWLRESANRDNPDAMFLLGKAYQDGRVRKWESSRKYFRAGKNEEEALLYDRAVSADWFLRAAELGHAESMVHIGKAYEHGVGVRQNPKQAFIWYKASATRGFPRAHNLLGYCYWKGFGVPKDLVEACRWYRRAAELGLPEGQANLGLAFAYGWAGFKDRTEAAHWFWAAASYGGDSKSAYELASLIEKGNGVQKDLGKSFGWYMCAAEAGYVKAMEKLARYFLDGVYCPQDKVEAAKWLRRAVDADSVYAMLTLGHMHEKGEGDYQIAFTYFQQAAERGDPKGRLYVAQYLETGRAIKKDLLQAIAIYKRLIRDFPSAAFEAYYHLGVCYEYGKGVPQDLIQAFNNYQLAYSECMPAATALGCVLLTGLPPMIQKDVEKARSLFDFAAVRGEPAAMYRLGLLWQTSGPKGTPADPSKAIHWFRSSASRNYAPAMSKLGSIYIEEAQNRHMIEEGVLYVTGAAEMGDVDAMDLLSRLYARGVEVDANGSLVRAAESTGSRLGLFKSREDNSGGGGGSKFFGKLKSAVLPNSSTGSSVGAVAVAASEVASVSTVNMDSGPQIILRKDLQESNLWKSKAAQRRKDKEVLDQAIAKAGKRRAPIEDSLVDAVDRLKIR